MHGYTPDDLVVLASEFAGTDLTEFMRKALRSNGKLDYTEALDWFGLRFAASTDSTKAWNLEVRADATPAQQALLEDAGGEIREDVMRGSRRKGRRPARARIDANYS